MHSKVTTQDDNEDMTNHARRHSSGRHSAKHTLMNSVAMFLVVALTGFLLMTNIKVNKMATVSSDTAELVEQRVTQVNRLQKQVKDLGAQVNTLDKAANGDKTEYSGDSNQDMGSSTVLAAVQGPGISVTLDDSPLWQHMVNSSGTASNINDYVIHQQDIEAVVNALWRGGAEAVGIQDQRLAYNAAISCKGNVLMLQGKQYSPPYTISAIGPTAQMQDALKNSSAIREYKEYVSAFGLGWKVEEHDNLKFPETPLLQTLKYAKAKKSQDDDR